MQVLEVMYIKFCNDYFAFNRSKKITLKEISETYNAVECLKVSLRMIAEIRKLFYNLRTVVS